MCGFHHAGCRHGVSVSEAGDDGGAACGCGGGRMERFLEPCLLLLLMKSQAHGYELLGRLAELGLDPEQQDPGLLYRTLRRLEHDGYLTSTWDTDSSGPAKRLYRVTGEGEELLHAWAGVVRRNVTSLETFLRSYSAFYGAESQEDRDATGR